jgi:hypothetical protein
MPHAMHLIVPFAAASFAEGLVAGATIPRPNLAKLLPWLQESSFDAGDEWSFTPPHERALAHSLGLDVKDGAVPMATWLARADGVALPPSTGVALLSPAHWRLGTEQLSLLHPTLLGLTEVDSRAFADALRPLFADEGLHLVWGSPTRWYLMHESLTGVRSASLDRVIGRNVDRWLPATEAVRRVRRLQAEAQMLLHRHPLNAQREAAGQLPLNSFWLSGSGPSDAPAWPAAGLQVALGLRDPALLQDAPAWRAAWAVLDAGPIAELLRLAQRGQALRLSLCGEHSALHLQGPVAPRLWQRIGRHFGAGAKASAADIDTLLERL